MPFVGHSKDAYTLALHHIYCLRQTPQEASAATGINATVIERCATGWMNGRDGRIGRAVFIYWLKGLRGSEGAPCCGAHCIPGKRPVPILGPSQAELRRLEELEELVRQAKAEIAAVREKVVRGAHDVYASHNDDADPTHHA
jgi:hypothetical protein